MGSIFGKLKHMMKKDDRVGMNVPVSIIVYDMKKVSEFEAFFQTIKCCPEFEDVKVMVKGDEPGDRTLDSRVSFFDCHINDTVRDRIDEGYLLFLSVTARVGKGLLSELMP